MPIHTIKFMPLCSAPTRYASSTALRVNNTALLTKLTENWHRDLKKKFLDKKGINHDSNMILILRASKTKGAIISSKAG